LKHKKLHKLYSLSIIIQAIKQRRIRLAEHTVGTEKHEVLIKILLNVLQENEHFRDLVANRII